MKTKLIITAPVVFFGLLLAGATVSYSEAPNQQEQSQDYFLISQDNMVAISDKIEKNGGQVKHEYSDRAGVVEMKPRLADELRIKGEVDLIASNVLQSSEVEVYDEAVREAAENWNYSQTQPNEIPAVEPGPIEGDALVEPGISDSAVTSAESYGYSSDDTTEYALGEVSVGVIFVESDGSVDTQSENWDVAKESQVSGEIQSAMDFWLDVGGSASQLSFNYHYYKGRTDSRFRTGYEPIKRVSWTSSGGQDLWINEIMGNMGYNQTSYFDQVRAFDDDLRNQDGSDWAFSIFVVDSENDSNGQFADGKFAYAYYGGPFLVTTYDNNGYGISNMDSVVAHETGHIFYALDQYASAGQPCTKELGYLSAPNQNSLYGSCLRNDASIMRGGVTPYINRSLDYYAAGQVGLWDSDSDGIYDIIDTFPSSSLSSSAVGSSGETVYSGSTSVSKVANQNPYTGTLRSGSTGNDITINTIAAVQYRIDGGSWAGATASDGAFNEPIEDFTFSVSGLGEGSHTVEVRAKNSAGNWETSYDSTGVTVGTDTIVTGAGYDGGPQIRIFSETGEVTNNGFFAYDSHVRSGVKIATGDLDGDGIDEIVTGTGSGGGPHIRVFDKNGNPKLTPGFFAYAEHFRGGVNVACGDLDGDGKDEIIAGAGNGGGPQIRVFEGNGTVKPIQFFAFHPDNRSGISVASADFDGDGKDEIVAGQLTNEEAWVKVYRYNNQKTVLANFRAYGEGVETGVNVAAADIDNDNIAEIITGPNYGGGPQIRTFELDTTPISSFFSYTESFRGGSYVAVGEFE